MGGRALGNGTSALLKGAPHFSPPGAHSEETRLGARSAPPPTLDPPAAWSGTSGLRTGEADVGRPSRPGHRTVRAAPTPQDHMQKPAASSSTPEGRRDCSFHFTQGYTEAVRSEESLTSRAAMSVPSCPGAHRNVDKIGSRISTDGMFSLQTQTVEGGEDDGRRPRRGADRSGRGSNPPASAKPQSCRPKLSSPFGRRA